MKLHIAFRGLIGLLLWLVGFHSGPFCIANLHGMVYVGSLDSLGGIRWEEEINYIGFDMMRLIIADPLVSLYHVQIQVLQHVPRLNCSWDILIHVHFESHKEMLM